MICLEEVTKICSVCPNLDHLIERIRPKFRLPLRTEEDKQSREVAMFFKLFILLSPQEAAMFSESPVGYHDDEERFCFR